MPLVVPEAVIGKGIRRAARERCQNTQKQSGILCNMSCEKCELLSRAETAATLQAADAEARLQAYHPEPPFGKVAAEELKRCQRALEESRAAVNLIRTRRTEHAGTHSLTISN